MPAHRTRVAARRTGMLTRCPAVAGGLDKLVLHFDAWRGVQLELSGKPSKPPNPSLLVGRRLREAVANSNRRPLDS